MTPPMPWGATPFGVLDGGLSTALERLGHRVDGLLWTARLVRDDPDAVVAAHASFVEAGADVVITASYQASEDGFVRAGATAAEARRLLASTTALARRSGAAAVAASIGPYGAILGDGSEYHGRYDADRELVRAFHRHRIAVLVDTGPDALAVETMPSAWEAEIVLEELAGCGSTIPAWVSFTCPDGSTTAAGDTIADAVSVVARAGAAAAVGAVGVNCTAPEHVAPLLRAAATRTDLPLVAYPNGGGTWDAASSRWVRAGAGAGDGSLGPVADWVLAGARLIGGCCGVGPEGVRAIAAARAA